jgi:hypothetical protein
MQSVVAFIVLLCVIWLNVVMLNVVILNVVMLNVVMLNVVMLKVVAPTDEATFTLTLQKRISLKKVWRERKDFEIVASLERNAQIFFLYGLA